MDRVDSGLPPIPAKRYFTIGEVSELCLVKPYVLRYWEQEFVQLKPMKRRGNRRYYQHHEVLLIRRIRELLYDQGFTISGARNQLAEQGGRHQGIPVDLDEDLDDTDLQDVAASTLVVAAASGEMRVAARALQSASHAASTAEAKLAGPQLDLTRLDAEDLVSLREALLEIRDLLA